MAVFLSKFATFFLLHGGAALGKAFKDDLAISLRINNVRLQFEAIKPTNGIAFEEELLFVEQKVSDLSSMGLLTYSGSRISTLLLMTTASFV